MSKSRLISLFLFLIFFISILFRLVAVLDNKPFWIDEFSSGVQAEIILEKIFNNKAADMDIEPNNILTHIIIGFTFLIFGATETSARLPFALIGSVLPIFVFFIAKKLYSKTAGFVAATLIAFSYFEITWSTQARGYILQQLISSLAILIYLNLKERPTIFRFILLIFTLILGFFTHFFTAFLIISIFIDFLLFKKSEFNKFFKKKQYQLFLILFLVFFSSLIYKLNIFSYLINGIKYGFISIYNNTWYYHSLLWREYSFIVLLALIGVLITIKNNKTWIMIFFGLIHLFFINFLFGHYMSKYLFPVFHIIIIFASIGLAFIGNAIKNKVNIKTELFTLILLIFILLNGDKFVLKPKKYYSVNHDMRDIALIDYHLVYNKILEKSSGNYENTAIVDTWADRSRWYLKKQFNKLYLFRWESAGFHKQTSFLVNSSGEKEITDVKGFKLISNISDLQKAMEKYQYGFIWIDDASLPKDVIDYVKQNFKEELYLDHYPLDDNPYSIWPGSLYSWGYDSANPFYKSL